MWSDHPDLDQVTALRAEGLQACPLFYDHPGARQKIRDQLEGCTTRFGLVEDGIVKAFIGWRDEPRAWTGTPLQSVYVEWVKHDDRAFDKIARLLRRMSGRLGPDTEAELHPGQTRLLPVLRSMGLHVEALVLAGHPQTALDKLVARDDPARDLAEHGLELQPMQPKHVESAMALWEWVFEREPEHCWFALGPYLKDKRDDLARAAAGDPEEFALVATSGDDVVGFFDASYKYDPFWGLKAGLNLVLDDRYRARGISKVVYRALLEEHVRRGVDVFMGGTSRPPVLHMARVLGRHLYSVVLGRRNRFPEGHWDLWL